MSQTPGGLHGPLIEEFGEPTTDKPCPPISEGGQGMGRVAAIAAEYGIEISTPPGR